MVQNTPKRPRGRPPAYDRDRALSQAGDTFWQGGYSATSLDDLSNATGMNRPSLYGAFGDKHALYMETLARRGEASQAAMRNLLAQDRPLPDLLMQLYDAALAIYLSGRVPRGCFLIGTALSEAVKDKAIRARLLHELQGADAAFEARFKRARETGELAADADVKGLAHVAAAMLNALAVRARAGESRSVLRATAAATVKLICGAPSPHAAERMGAPKKRA